VGLDPFDVIPKLKHPVLAHPAREQGQLSVFIPDTHPASRSEPIRVSHRNIGPSFLPGDPSGFLPGEPSG
jgi:hypothetical protein